jgi:hypothetical protein
MDVRKADGPTEKKLAEVDRSEILLQTAATSNFRSLVDVIDVGPKARSGDRKMYRFKDGAEGDVYRCVLRAIASAPPKLSFTQSELLQRVIALCEGDAPPVATLVGTCMNMQKLLADKFPNERVFDWDEQKQVLDLPDPYLLFYLRWSGRLTD